MLNLFNLVTNMVTNGNCVCVLPYVFQSSEEALEELLVKNATESKQLMHLLCCSQQTVGKEDLSYWKYQESDLCPFICFSDFPNNSAAQ